MQVRDLRYILGIWVGAGAIALHRPSDQTDLIEQAQVIIFIALTMCLTYGLWRTVRDAKRRKVAGMRSDRETRMD